MKQIYPVKTISVLENKTVAYTLLCECHDECLDAISAIKAAAKNIAGKSHTRMTIHDLLLYANAENCIPHGFRIVGKIGNQEELDAIKTHAQITGHEDIAASTNLLE